MFQAVIEERENQLVLTVPPEVQQELHLKLGDRVQVEISEGSQAKRRRYDPGQLLREHAEIMDQLPDNSEWLNSPPVGRELI